MGKSTGFKFAGRGPGLQKSSKLQRQFLVKKGNRVKTGSMKDLDFGVEQAEKVPDHLVQTGLNTVRAPDVDEMEEEEEEVVKAPAPEVVKARQAAKRTPKALGPRVKTGKAIPAATPTPVSAETTDGHQSRVAGALMSEQWGAVAESARVGDRDELKDAQREQAAKTALKKSKKCAPC